MVARNKKLSFKINKFVFKFFIILHLPPVCVSDSSVSSENKISAEIRLVLLKISNKESFRSFQNLIPALQAAIQDSPTLESLRLSRTKATYLVTEAMGPHFKESMLKTIRSTKHLYTILFDETTNSKKIKELVIAIRFFSEQNQKVIYFNIYINAF